MTDQKAQPSQDYPTAAFAKHLAELGVKATDVGLVDIDARVGDAGVPAKVPAIWDRNQQKLSSVKALIEEYRTRPERRKGMAAIQTLDSFIALVNRHKDEDSAVFMDANWRAPSFTAVVDYHTLARTPRNLTHRISYAFPLSEEWKLWLEKDGKAMTQADFAAFIENRIAELTSPLVPERKEFSATFMTDVAEPAVIIQLSRGLAVAVNAKVSQAVMLQSGEGEIIFEEVHRDGKGQKLSVPGVFMLSLPVFFRGPNVRMPVRLRYRVRDGAVTWFYQIWRPDVYTTEAILAGRDKVAAETKLPIYEGAPEA